MKLKIYAIAAVTTFLITSCSSPEEAAVNEFEGILVTTPIAEDDACGDLYEGIETVKSGSIIEQVAASLPDETLVVRAVKDVTAYVSASQNSEVLREFVNPKGDNTQPLVFRVIETDEDGEWTKVQLPIKPNGCTGWISNADLEIVKPTPYRIFIDTANHKLNLYKSGELLIDTEIAVGTGESKTPLGSFYIEETVQTIQDNSPYGPYAFGLSGYSEDLDSFAGGDAVIGIHGTNDPSSIGKNVSSGCIRTPNDVISEMIKIVPRGTPVEIF